MVWKLIEILKVINIGALVPRFKDENNQTWYCWKIDKLWITKWRFIDGPTMMTIRLHVLNYGSSMIYWEPGVIHLIYQRIFSLFVMLDCCLWSSSSSLVSTSESAIYRTNETVQFNKNQSFKHFGGRFRSIKTAASWRISRRTWWNNFHCKRQLYRYMYSLFVICRFILIHLLYQ